MGKSAVIICSAVVLTAGYAAWGQVRAAKPTVPPTRVISSAKQALPKPLPEGPVSYTKQVLPIFQAQCQGCHQPAKISGGYLMTAFDRLVAGGASGKPAIVPGKPGESRLVEMITPRDGKAKMPPAGSPLRPEQVALIARWVREGARDDSSVAAARYDAENPPVYTRPPVIAALDYSPDGKLLAVSGFHEVFLYSADGSRRVARLIGGSERIEAVRFSPDGSRLAVSGGSPARRGELQIWDVETHRLLRSISVTGDTLRGASWSPDGKHVAVACADNTVRAFEAESGNQVMQQGSHTDWPLDTTFSKDGSHVISVGRDQTVKLTEVATQRFVDNITSITPGALRGGVPAVARHPQRDEVVTGGADGIVRVYRVFRQVQRVIGDDSNLIREMPPLKGRIFDVDVSADGHRIAAVASLDGAAEAAIYSYEFDTSLPDEIKAIQAKVAETRSAEERAKLDAYHRAGVKVIAKTSVPGSSLYAVAFHPDGKTVAAAGTDGSVRFLNAETGSIAGSFSPTPVTGVLAARLNARVPRREDEPPVRETAPTGAPLVSLTVEPARVDLSGPFSYAQLVVTGRLQNGQQVDLTRVAARRVNGGVATLSASGLVEPRAEGTGTIVLSHQGRSVALPVSVSGLRTPKPVDFLTDVQPMLSRLGCNAGTCHGSKEGKNGFKLSLRGYDGLFDIRSFTDDLSSRRVNLASPDDSLMILKAVAGVPHAGGRVFRPGSFHHEMLRRWIEAGAPFRADSPRVTSIAVTPVNPIIPLPGGRQQMRVVATYADGLRRDVTREAFIESGNTEIASSSTTGVVTALRRGEAPLLARYEGAYAATTLTVMGDRTGFAWQPQPANNRIDVLTAAKWRRMKILPSGLCTDAEFIRRVTLDLTGLPPTADEVRAFLSDTTPSRRKRDALVDRLVGSPAYVEYWTNKWADLLQVNRKFLGLEGAVAFRRWIRDQIAANTPYDEFARRVVTASGSNKDNPPASYFKILRDPATTMENTTHLFLAVRFNCNKCHDHPFERWTQDQYYHLAAYFAQVGLKRDPASGNQNIGGTAVEGAKPLYEVVFDASEGEIKHDRTGEVTPPKFPYACNFEAPKERNRREELAAWLTSPDNPYFARSLVNRLWGYLFGPGLIDPIDDIRAGNPPSNPELLDFLTQYFVANRFDVQAVMRLICKSRTYQLSAETNRWNADDRINYSHALPRRLPAEVLYDAIHRVTGAASRLPGVPAGTRAAELPDSGVELPSGFFATFGRPPRESACECERTSGMDLGPVMALVSGPTVADAIGDPQNELAKLVAREQDDAKVVDEIFLRILNRPATPAEIKAALANRDRIRADHEKLVAAMKKREADLPAITARRERERQEAIAAAQKEIADYEPESKKLQEQRAAEREKSIMEASDRIRAHETNLARSQEEWEKRQPTRSLWTVLQPATLQASSGAVLTLRPDGSIVATGPNAKTTYTLTAKTNLRGITGLRLETLPDPSLPNQGPGRAGDGNFVLTEIELYAAPASDPAKLAKIDLQKPRADFSQQGLDVRFAVDGKTNEPNQGWAISPSYKVPHWAVFETATAVGGEGETVLRVTIHHQFNQPQYTLGRFRLSVTTQGRDFPLGLSEELQQVVSTPAAERTDAQRQALAAYYRALDGTWIALNQALATVSQPLGPDPKMEELKATLAEVSRPLGEDSLLAQLRADVKASEQQLKEERLTAAQDLAWALINSPAFLFNH